MEVAQKFGLSVKWLELERTGALLCMGRRQLDTDRETLLHVCVFTVCGYVGGGISVYYKSSELEITQRTSHHGTSSKFYTTEKSHCECVYMCTQGCAFAWEKARRFRNDTDINSAPLSVNFKNFKAPTLKFRRAALACVAYEAKQKVFYSPIPPLSSVSAWCKLTDGRNEWNK